MITSPWDREVRTWKYPEDLRRTRKWPLELRALLSSGLAGRRAELTWCGPDNHPGRKMEFRTGEEAIVSWGRVGQVRRPEKNRSVDCTTHVHVMAECQGVPFPIGGFPRDRQQLRQFVFLPVLLWAVENWDAVFLKLRDKVRDYEVLDCFSVPYRIQHTFAPGFHPEGTTAADLLREIYASAKNDLWRLTALFTLMERTPW